MSLPPVSPLRPRSLDTSGDARDMSSRTPTQRLADALGAAPTPLAARALLLAQPGNASPAMTAALASAIAATLPSVFESANVPADAGVTTSPTINETGAFLSICSTDGKDNDEKVDAVADAPAEDEEVRRLMKFVAC